MIHLGQINGDSVTTLGLDPVEDQRPLARLEHNLCSQLLPLVEDVLYDKCLALLSIMEPGLDTGVARRVLHTQIVRLGDRVTELVTSMEKSEVD